MKSLRLHAHDLLRKRALHHIINPQTLKHVPFFFPHSWSAPSASTFCTFLRGGMSKVKIAPTQTFVLFLLQNTAAAAHAPLNPVKLAERKHRILFYIKIRCVLIYFMIYLNTFNGL